MSDNGQSQLLHLARMARADASLARRLAGQISDNHTRTTLLRFAEDKEARAVELEEQAAGSKPPVVQRHAQQQQMQQTRAIQSAQDEGGPDKPTKSN